MDRIMPSLYRSDNYGAWIGSFVTQPGHSEIASSTPYIQCTELYNKQGVCQGLSKYVF